MLIQWRRNALNVRNFENKFEEKLLYYFNFEKHNSEENVYGELRLKYRVNHPNPGN